MAPKTYNGACHCGDVTYTVKLEEALAPEGKGKVLACNCSICTKNGYLLVYPYRQHVVWGEGCEAKLKDYYMGKKNKAHRFCPTCSSSILIDFQHSDVADQRPLLAMNARLFEGVDLAKADFEYYDGWANLGPDYGRDVAKRVAKGDGKGEA